MKKLKLKNEKNEEFKNLSKDYKNFDKLSKNYVIFKTIDSITGTIIKYKTNKSKDVSRLITFAGPLGVQSTKTKLIKKNEDKININDDDKNKDIEMKDVSENNNKSKISYTVNIRGLSSVMTNKKFESKIVENTPELETSAVAAIAAAVASTGDNSVSKESTPQPQSQQAPSSSKSKKNKKKGKKR